MISILRDPQACRALWTTRRSGWSLLQDWDLRCRLAAHDGVAPHFLRHEESGTVLPAGLRGETLWFFGGLHYAERNGFAGPPGGERAIFEWLGAQDMKVRLLSWEHDPLPFLPDQLRHWDVPYNQYWEMLPDGGFETILDRVGEGTAKEFAYLERKFGPQIVPDDRLMTLIDEFIAHTIESFARRNARCTYADPHFRAMTMAVVDHFHSRGLLRAVLATYAGEAVGLGVFAEDAARGEALYMLNLYKPSPSKVSNLLTMAMIRHCAELGLKLDGMRGAFSLKPRSGYRPAPSYALVSDPAWTVRPQTDLAPEALLALYGRRFGAEAIPETS